MSQNITQKLLEIAKTKKLATQQPPTSTTAREVKKVEQIPKQEVSATLLVDVMREFCEGK